MNRAGVLGLGLLAIGARSLSCFAGGPVGPVGSAGAIPWPDLLSPSGTPWVASTTVPSVVLIGQASPVDEKSAQPDPKPDSKDELFGIASDDSRTGARLGGFIEGLGAYTYSQPTHWSRGVGRLQLVGQGEFSDSVKWKVGGRVDGDIVYATSDFYLDPVKRNQRADAIWSENYIDLALGSLAFRLGAQQIVWGEVVGLFVADVVSARDTREFLLPSFDLIRIPQWAARAEYFAGDAHIELIWIPVPTFDRIGKPGADFYPAPLPSPTSQKQAALFENPVTPGRNLGNSSWGVRGNTLISGWDIAAFYYRSLSTSPTFYRVPTGVPDPPFAFQPRYDRIWQIGATGTKDLGEVVLRGEAVYTHGQGYSVTSLATPQGVVVRSTLDYILSAEFVPTENMRVNVQAFQRVYYGGPVNDLVINSDGFGGSLLISTKLGSALEPQLLWIQSFNGGGGLIRPRLDWYAAKNTTVGFGFDIFTGPSDGYFGRYNNRDRVYSEIRYNF